MGLASLGQRLRGRTAKPHTAHGGRPIPDALWQSTLSEYGFLQALPADEQSRLRQLASHFLAHKEFHGAQGLEVTDAMAVAIGGGLLGATVLTLLVLPVMYAAWYKANPDEKDLQGEMN